MKASIKMMTALCSASTLLGCAVNEKATEMKIVPTMRVQHSYESADGYYALGRYYHGGRRFEEARKAYEQALRLDPAHTNAGNALAVLYAETGKLQQASGVLQKLVAEHPNDSQLLSNIGHVYFLNGEYEKARSILAKATALDPGNAAAWNNLGSVLQILGDVQGSHDMFANARAVRQSKPSASSATINNSARGNPLRERPVAQELQTAGAASGVKTDAGNQVRNNRDNDSRTEVRQIETNIYMAHQAGLVRSGNARLPDFPAAAVHTEKTASPAPSQSISFAVRVEISNGNGVNGMARSVGNIIANANFRVVRLTNQSGFRVSSTRIEYRRGYEQAAHNLAEQLGHPVSIQLNTSDTGTEVRLVLGRDMRDLNTIRAHYQDRFKVAEIKRTGRD